MRALLRRVRLAALFLLLAVPAEAAAPPTAVEAGAGQFVQDLAEKVLAIFNDPHLSREQKEQRLYPLAVKAFDVPRTARFVLGRYWKDAPAAQREDFTKTFERYIVHVYAGQFDLYHDVEFQTVYTRPEGEGGTLVRTKIVRHDGGPPTTVDWWVAKTETAYRITDVTVEGVSQLIALREQFASVINAHGGNVAALIEDLRAKIAG